jgi:hypothetical protein
MSPPWLQEDFAPVGIESICKQNSFFVSNAMPACRQTSGRAEIVGEPVGPLPKKSPPSTQRTKSMAGHGFQSAIRVRGTPD